MGITTLIGMVTIVLLLIFSIFTFSAGKNSKLSNIFLTLFLLSNLFYLLEFLLPTFNEIFRINTQSIAGIGNTFCFLFGPTLFLFTKSLTDYNYTFKNSEYLHFAMFALALLLVVASVEVNGSFIYYIFNIQVVLYLINCIKVISNYRKGLKNYFSTVDKINFSWLIYTVGAFIIMWCADFINIYLDKFGLITPFISNSLTFISVFINFAFVILLFYRALHEPQFLIDIGNENQEKYQGSNLTLDDKKKYLDTIQEYFRQNNAYLNSSLTISDVAESTNISIKYISQVLNELVNKNFYDFTNSFRIEMAKEKLLSNEDDGLTILEILYDSGFNSKSAFNAAFKKHTGMTPTEYRRQRLAS